LTPSAKPTLLRPKPQQHPFPLGVLLFEAFSPAAVGSASRSLLSRAWSHRDELRVTHASESCLAAGTVARLPVVKRANGTSPFEVLHLVASLNSTATSKNKPPERVKPLEQPAPTSSWPPNTARRSRNFVRQSPKKPKLRQTEPEEAETSSDTARRSRNFVRHRPKKPKLRQTEPKEAETSSDQSPKKPKLRQAKFSERRASPRIPNGTEAPPGTLEETRTLPGALIETKAPTSKTRQPT
jgi:hypothetical protein